MQATTAVDRIAPSVPPAPAQTPLASAVRARRYLSGDRICPGLLACEPLGARRRMERWLAWSRHLWSHVVVELPRDEHADDLATVRELRREAQVLRRLNHPAVPRVLRDAHDDPVPHLVLEHRPGTTLDRLVAAEGVLRPAQIVRIGLRLAACLRHVHEQGLVLSAVEPGQIALCDGQPVLLDFGAVRRAGRARWGGHGVLTGGQPDPRSDLFGLGAVLYQLATGRPAFRGGDLRAGHERRSHGALPVPARTLRPALPPGLDATIHALLERDPRRRPQTAVDTIGMLSSALPGDEVRIAPPLANALLGT